MSVWYNFSIKYNKRMDVRLLQLSWKDNNTLTISCGFREKIFKSNNSLYLLFYFELDVTIAQTQYPLFSINFKINEQLNQ